MILFIFDYSSGTVFKHVLSKEDENLDNWEDKIFSIVCNNAGIREKDCYYMITEQDDFVEI